MSYSIPISKICENCSQTYLTKSGKSKTCSKKCSTSLWGKNNREQKAIKLAEWRESNPDKALNNYINRDKEKEAIQKANYYKINKDKIIQAGIERASRRYHSDLNFKLRKILRCRMLNAIKGGSKGGSVITNLGCSIEELKKYLESKFKPGMTWNNHGIDGWHIDHKEPLVNFDLTKPEQVKIACHYSNLQPLWVQENLIKADN
jgi:hypothetical protein